MTIEVKETKSMLKTLNLYNTADKYDELINSAVESALSYEKFLDKHSDE